MSQNALLSEVAKGANLKSVETVDKSGPKIDSDVHIKKNEHGALLGEISKGANLTHVETVDKSAPKIDANTHVGQNQHGALLSEIKAKGDNHERSLLQYGTKKERLGKDSIKNFDCCVLCLNELRSPMSCTKGHLYCKECIYSNLLDQKKEIKRKEKEWEQQQAKLQADKEKIKEKEQQDIVEKFEKDTVSAIGDKTTTTTTTAAAGTMELKSFWIPSLTPDNREAVLDKPSTNTICTEGGHLLKLKQLITVQFTPIRAKDDSTNSDKYCCPICKKTLSNSSELRMLKRCGHVFCSCLSKFDSTGCYVCDKPYTKDTVISLQKGGTGYAGSGSKLEAQKYTPTAII
ncbi:hypothetical protein CYY_006603 [Polysphondylium violaceum]|uniref:RING-type domain-containing protein n=1 Tax=Polysphondylium violaceum TaxID=133409 RepID=A0A8J4PR39_9MYCE|nr:hypothetical protein CYY_006603 [Polysphondylium violaceum]